MKNANILPLAGFVLALSTFAVLSPLAVAKDLGTQAQVWEIAEQDFREVVLSEAARVDWSKKNQELKDNAQSYTANLPKRNFSEATKTETKYIDPSIQLTSDIKIPVKGSDGNYSWQVYYKKGQSLNPLTKLRPPNALFFFDGRSPEQVALAKELTSSPLSRVVPLEASGENFSDVVKDFGRPVFYAFDAQIQRFAIDRLPALVYPGSGQYSLYLATTVFAKPYRVDQIRAYWPTTRTPTEVKK